MSHRKKTERGILLLLFLVIALGCSKETASFEWRQASWEDIVSAAEGTEVGFYMWGGSTTINRWIDTVVADRLSRKYSIKLKRIPMDAPLFVNRLLAEKEAGRKKGSIDLMWINGENFKRAMEGEVLLGPFASKLPNFNAYVDPDTARFDFGYPVDGHEAPYGRAQFVFEYDTAPFPQ